MTTQNDTEFGELATELVDEFGTTITFAVTTGKVYTPGSSSASAGTTTLYPVKTSAPFGFDLKWIDGDIVRAGDLKVVLAGTDADGVSLPFTPAEGITAVIHGRTYTVVAVMPHQPSDDRVAYTMQLRQGIAA